MGISFTGPNRPKCIVSHIAIIKFFSIDHKPVIKGNSIFAMVIYISFFTFITLTGPNNPDGFSGVSAG